MGAEQNIDWASTVASALDWWHEAGVDAAISERPHNWLAPEAPPTPVARPEPAPDAARSAPVATLVFPDTLSSFEAWRIGSDAPDGGWSGTRIGAQGAASAGLMIVVEMPEREDGETKTLLSGTVGKLFDRMLATMARDRQSIYLVPMCVARPPSGRIPEEDEPALAAALHQQMMLAAPRQLLIFGNAASRALIGSEIVQARGGLRRINYAGGEAMAVASFHPRLLLERPAAKPEAWKDLQLLIRGTEN